MELFKTMGAASCRQKIKASQYAERANALGDQNGLILHKDTLDIYTDDNWDTREYEFERVIDGGRVRAVSGFNHISERIVRMLGLEHGDIVKATKRIALRESSGYRYEFALVRKRPKNNEERTQLDRCLVGRGYVIKCYASGDPIKIEGHEFVYSIKKEDIKRLFLLEGDIVDVAYPKGKPEKAKVIWRHNRTKRGEGS